MKLDEHLQYIQFNPENITYEEYCLVLDSMLGKCSLTEISLTAIKRSFQNLFKQLRTELVKISNDFNLSNKELIASFKSKDIFGIFKGFGFKVRLMFKAIQELTKFVREGLLSIFKELADTKIIQKLRRRIIKVDQLIKKYPLLAKITGIAIAGLLLYIWLNMTFIGNLDYDFDFSSIADAISGKFSIADLFLSAEGLMLMALFGTGVGFGLSIPWLGKSLYNLILAIVYTANKRIKRGGYKVKVDRRFKIMLGRLGKERI